MKDDANYVCPKCAAQSEPEVQDSTELLLDRVLKNKNLDDARMAERCGEEGLCLWGGG